MKCTDKEWMHCRVEKMGCSGCYYDEIKIGEWIRNKDGYIDKVKKIIHPDEYIEENYYCCKSTMASSYRSQIVKHSESLIDLIEIGDIVERVIEVLSGEDDTEKFEVVATGVKDIKGNNTNEIGISGENEINFIPFKSVKKILTKEQFEENCFDVGDYYE